MEGVLHTIANAEAALQIIAAGNTVAEEEGRAVHGLANTISGAVSKRKC
jgi:hypothetical protein